MTSLLRTRIGNPKYPSATLEAIVDVSGPFTLAAAFGKSDNCELFTQAGTFTVRAPLADVFAAIQKARNSGDIIAMEFPEPKPEPKTQSQQSEEK